MKTYTFTFEVIPRMGWFRRLLNWYPRSKLVEYSFQTSSEYATDALARALECARKDNYFVLRIASTHV